MAEIATETKINETPKVRKHKTFGEYKSVIVDWKQPHKGSVDIFVSVNDYTVTFKPDTEVSLPKDIITFIKEATYEEHFFNKETKLHETRPKRKYSVEQP